MTISGWYRRYSEIVKDFGFSKKKDQESAILLDGILKKQYSINKLEKIIRNKTIFVIGSGPSLLKGISFLKKYENITKIAADSSIKLLMENQIRPEILITDLDGDEKYLKEISKTNTIVVVHAHGDNISKLPFAENFKNCLGTTQNRPIGKLYNFGGFTDGDRGVFLANHFGAKKIILIGMDFGKKIGTYSKTKPVDRKIKLKKLQWGEKLLEWLAQNNKIGLFTTSGKIKGFKKIRYSDIEKELGS